MVMQPIIASAWQASQVYGGVDGVPRQRQVFMVRFKPGAASAGDLGPLTYVVKHCDRPKISPKIEELNQYNKKRVIYTGYKVEPVKIGFYDSADGSAQDLWTRYARYYFGDFVTNAEYSYGYDMTLANFNNGFQATAGLSEEYAGGSADNSSQWFFDSIEIYQFYISGNTRLYDCYTLLHPRISSYEPDELDYESSVVAQINMTFVYENLQYKAGQSVVGSPFDEFSNKSFNGRPVVQPSAGATSVGSSGEVKEPANPAVGSIMRTVSAAGNPSAPYRMASDAATGALGTFGQYIYGLPGTEGLQGIVSGIGNPLGANLPAAALGAINAAQTGTAQYGINLATQALNPQAAIDYFSTAANSTFDFALPDF